MNGIELKVIRVRKNISVKRMSELLGITRQSYRLKETGKRPFSDNEKLILVNVLGLDFEKYNFIFYDSKLPFGNLQ